MKVSELIATMMAVLLVSASAAFAGPVSKYVNNPAVKQIAEQLVRQGYVIVEIERTWLGRLKIDAIANGFEREILISSVSGMVLHDDWAASPGQTIAGLDMDKDGIADTLTGATSPVSPVVVELGDDRSTGSDAEYANDGSGEEYESRDGDSPGNEDGVGDNN